MQNMALQYIALGFFKLINQQMIDLIVHSEQYNAFM